MTSKTHNLPEKYYSPVVMPESVKESSRFGVNMIVSFVAMIAGLIWFTTSYQSVIESVKNSMSVSQTVVPNQFAMTSEAPGLGAMVIVAGILFAVLIPLLVFSIMDTTTNDRIGSMPPLIAVFVVAIVGFAISFVAEDSRQNIAIEAMAEYAGIDMVSSSKSEVSGIISVSDGGSSYNFVPSKSDNTFFLTLQQ